MDFLRAFFERMGLNAFATGDYPAAERWFRRLEKREPGSVRVLHNLGVARLAQRDLGGAEACFLREEALHGASFHRHLVLGDVARLRGDRSAALERYAAALERPDAPGQGSPERRFAELRLRLCSDAKSFARSLSAAELFEDGLRHERAGDAKAALDSFDRAAELDPTHWPALNNAGSLLLNILGDPSGALARFESAGRITNASAVVQNAALAREAASVPAKRESSRRGLPGSRGRRASGWGGTRS